MKRLVVLLAAVLAAAAAVQGSQATFTASKTNGGSSFATAVKFPPVVTVTAPANGSATNDATPAITGTAGHATGDTSTVTVKIYSGPSATGSALQTKSATRNATTGAWSTTASALTPGTYTVQATQTDTSGNTGTSAANTFKVDTTRPAPVKALAANASGGTAGKLDAGDTVTYTYSEPVAPSSVLTGWDGSSQSVTVRFTNSNGNDSFAVTGTNLGSVATNGNYVTTSTNISATMVRSADGASIVVTLGTPSNVASSPVTGRNMTWTVGTAVTDLAGNAVSTTSWSETGSTVDF